MKKKISRKKIRKKNSNQKKLLKKAWHIEKANIFRKNT